MMKSNRFLRITAFLLVAVILATALSGCKGDERDATSLSFKDAAGYDYLKTLDGEYVTISGYMATSSPVDGSFIFLMNLPYQSCPFCIPNTSQLSNTMEIYPKKGESFSYTTQAIQVVGVLEVSDSEDKPFVDEYGYKFCCKIVDATYTIIKAEDLSEKMALWQRIAESDVISDIYAMYNFLDFVTNWPAYYVNSYTNADGEKVNGYFLYASDALHFLQTDGAQWNFGYKEDYFDKLVAKVEAIDPDAFDALEKNIREAETLARRAISDLEGGLYTKEYKYVEQFGQNDYIYTLNHSAELRAEMDRIYYSFSDWLGEWEL